MAVNNPYIYESGVWFITFTNYKWLPLFSITNSYDLVYKWFDVLKAKGHHIIGYGIMPNHLHLLAALNYDNKERLNTLIGNAKRFMAYGIINRLEKMGKQDMLNRLTDGVQRTDKIKGQLHRVFEPSFDAKRCDSFFMYSGGLLTRDPPRTESIVKLINKPPTNLAEPS